MEFYDKLAVEWGYFIEDRDKYANNLCKRMQPNFDKKISPKEEKIIHMLPDFNNGVTLSSRKIKIENNMGVINGYMTELPYLGDMLVGLINNSTVDIQYDLYLNNTLFDSNILKPNTPTIACREYILQYPVLTTVFIKLLNNTNITSLEIVDGWIENSDREFLYRTPMNFGCLHNIIKVIHHGYGNNLNDINSLQNNIELTVKSPNFQNIYNNLPNKKRIKARQNIFIEELIAKTCHPNRINQI